MANKEGPYSVISGNDLQRIRSTARPQPPMLLRIRPASLWRALFVAVPQATVAHLEKERLKKLSEERAGRWPNTIQVREMFVDHAQRPDLCVS
eukprot:4213979-Pyramimonas_sp.AAC.2